ncbi:MAG TPA: protease pro-enzyme activation domain-containing protein, partial [Candidatus Sulfotelmatobacter sp.]|nr:protease pro-enzyme activation domain-containing protein [Candidatus Sulfotelmatobacter sp.]
MYRKIGSISLYVPVLTYLLGFGFLSQAQAQPTTPLVNQYIDESKVVTLRGNTRPEAKPENDRGAVADNFRMEHMLLQLHRAPKQEQAVKLLVDQLHNPQSPNFHHWLSAREFGERFGLAQQDIDTVVRWLEFHGFQINSVYPSRILIDFSGTAGQVRQAFHTEIHHIEVNGVAHVANVRDPQLPAALAPSVVGVVSLHDFRPHPMVKPRGQYTTTNSSGTAYAVLPGDLATIYNFTPVFNSGVSGQGQTIALIEDTDLFSTSDWSTFRSTFGLAGYTGSLLQVHPAPPSGPNNCSDPGVNADDGEAILDAEYASAAAPSAAIEMASCKNTTSTFGGLIAIQNLINASTNPPAIVSVSYGECESVNGSAANAAYNSTYQQAVVEGVSVYVAAGDSGAAGCDEGQSAAANGIAVSGFASTPYNVAVGGTDFGDTYAGTNSTYWNSVNSPYYASALSYVPEIPWNGSCAGALYDTKAGYPSYGSNSLCNIAGGLLAELSGVLTTAAGGGGPSSCAVPTSSGSCVGYPKPTWQQVFGNPCGATCSSSTNDGVRDLPDISLFAANGLWSHYYIFCYSDAANGGTACTGPPSGWTGAGGTSFASPIMAGVQALVDQKMGSRQGNPNPVFYSLAATQYGTAGDSSCNSTLGNAVSPACIFYDITLGDIAVDCTGNTNCFDSGSGYGVLSTSKGAYAPAYGAGTGWDFASGIGSVNVANLVSGWPGSNANPDFSLWASGASLTLTEGGVGVTSTIVVASTNGFNGSVCVSALGQPSGVVASFNPSCTTGTSVLTLTASGTATTGTFRVTITGTSGALNHTTTISLAVNAPTTTTVSSSLNPSSFGQSVTLTATVSPSAATGTVQFFDGLNLLGTAALSGGTASLSILSLPVGSHPITAHYGGDSNFASSTSPVLVEAVNTSTALMVRVNAGGPLYVDSRGQTWQADKGFSGGSTYSTTSAIAGTSDPTLFRTQ